MTHHRQACTPPSASPSGILSGCCPTDVKNLLSRSHAFFFPPSPSPHSSRLATITTIIITTAVMINHPTTVLISHLISSHLCSSLDPHSHDLFHHSKKQKNKNATIKFYRHLPITIIRSTTSSRHPRDLHPFMSLNFFFTTAIVCITQPPSQLSTQLSEFILFHFISSSTLF